jgi:DMSO reductase anchor subunit
MRPTFSIIAFTVLSGTGYGLWFLLGLGLAIEWPVCAAVQPATAPGVPMQLCEYPSLIAYALLAGFLMVTAGLLASLGHLGQPRRAWRAFSQWRSSWLSREGVASIITYVPAALLILIGLALLFRPMDEPLVLLAPAAARALGAALALMSALTVYCTANIYSSLKPIRAWHNRYVVALYLLLGLYGGALCLWLLTTVPEAMGAAASEREMPVVLATIASMAAFGFVLKTLYWRDIDRTPPVSAGVATGLDALGIVRSFEQPHIEENYLTREMGFVLARKHASKLRAISLIVGFAIPGLLAVLALAVPASRSFAAWIAFICGMSGLFVERWLFFAQARHAVMGYYARN